ncbi:hypothetical protein OIU85_024326 [Salix viminalis]|uniref:Uncharacterized protein n=1 Tax=Salix viminalis TaxID=40686 RepID=A0A9Q0Z4P2_SALVM|nr:hypothetical protein OIU85_024326 [Salix viminalis]
MQLWFLQGPRWQSHLLAVHLERLLATGVHIKKTGSQGEAGTKLNGQNYTQSLRCPVGFNQALIEIQITISLTCFEVVLCTIL